ncbi:MAG: hypothetical protein EAZ24_09750, partial [Burkholderiales bacterium]
WHLISHSLHKKVRISGAEVNAAPAFKRVFPQHTGAIVRDRFVAAYSETPRASAAWRTSRHPYPQLF